MELTLPDHSFSLRTGKTRFIGLSNFNCQHIRQVRAAHRIFNFQFRRRNNSFIIDHVVRY